MRLPSLPFAATACGPHAPPTSPVQGASVPSEPSAPDGTPRVSGRLGLAGLEAFGAGIPSAYNEAYNAPVAGYDAGICKVNGPLPGEIAGTPLGKPGTLEATLVQCLADERCTGVSSAWYGGMDFSAMKSSSPFAQDTNSYDCTVLVDCP
ncbi:MAG: hypothetical protein ACI8RZ_005120 [Myxococcota bacterium]|jgi:hypothetical protein